MKRSSNHLAKISWGNVSYITIGLLYLKTWSKLQTQISKNGYLMNPKILTDFVPNQRLPHDQPNTLFISTDPLLHLVSSLTQSLIWSASIKRLFIHIWTQNKNAAGNTSTSYPLADIHDAKPPIYTPFQKRLMMETLSEKSSLKTTEAIYEA